MHPEMYPQAHSPFPDVSFRVFSFVARAIIILISGSFIFTVRIDRKKRFTPAAAKAHLLRDIYS